MLDDLDQIRQQLDRQYQVICQSIALGDRTIELYRPAEPDVLLDQMLDQPPEHIDIQDERLPYWAELWPSSIALASYLRSVRLLNSNMRVLELGCGLGLAGVSAGYDTPHVLFTDYQAAALQFAELNWRHNVSGPFQGRVLDWREPCPELAADVVLAADVAYESRAFEPLVRAFGQLARPEGVILIAEPGRKVARGYVAQLAQQLRRTCQTHSLPVQLDTVTTEVLVHHLEPAHG